MRETIRMGMRRDYDLVCFDMDGTLTNIRSSWRWVHDCLGVDSEPNYRAYLNQEIDIDEFMRRDIALWTGVKPDFSEKDLIRCFQTMPLVGGIQETVAALEDCGMHCVIISGGIDLAAEMLMKEFGFEDFIADHVNTNPDGTLTGEGTNKVNLEDKSIWVREYQKRYGTTQERTVSIGNSFTDIPMFKASGLSIAFNPTDPYTEEAATHTVRSDNIADILDYVIPAEKDGPGTGF